MIAGIYCSFGFCRATFLAHIPAHVQDLGFSLADGANVLAVITGSSMFSRIGMGRVADRMGNRKPFMISFAATTISLIWGLAADDLWKLYLFAFVFGVGWGNQAVLRFSLTSEVFGIASLGLVMGVLGVAESVAATFGSYFAGYIFDVFGSYQPVFWMGIGISVIGILLAWLLKPAIISP
jgi:MFS family permease